MTPWLANITAFVLLFCVTAYSVAGGVDYGAGIWDLLAGRGTQAERVRALIDHAMAPVWEANNVWLVLSIVICWTGFPLLFASVFESLYPLFAIALLGVILRGSFFAFRHVAEGPLPQRRMSVVFGISSLLTPFCFAASLGAIASGRVAVGGPTTSVLAVCFSPLSVCFGLVSLAATAFSGASFLVGDARRYRMPELVEYFRRRAIIAGGVLILMGSLALAVAGFQSPSFLRAMFTGSGAPFAVVTILVTPFVVWLLLRRIFRAYRVLTVVVVAALVLAWGLAQSPYLLPGALTVAQAAAPLPTQVLLVVVTLSVVFLILPSLALLVYLDQRNILESSQDGR
jgi:cytochrome bd ubiquinol oxidase subunit II